MLTQVEGPIAIRHGLPFGSAMAEGSPSALLLKEFDYVEEEFFLAGTADVYGPAERRQLEPGEDVYALKPLSTACRRDMPYKTRALVIRPRDPARFSGIVHAIPFHNLLARAETSRHLLRDGHVWVGVEVCDGTRFGTQEIPSGGMANLHRVDPDRYGELAIGGGQPDDWPALTPGALGKAFETLKFPVQGPEMNVFLQELSRSYAQGPGIFFDVARGLKLGDHSVLPGFPVRRIFTSGGSGGSVILRPLVDYHHNANLLPDGSPAVDGYLVMVGVVPEVRPDGAVLVILHDEGGAIQRETVDHRAPDPDTDEPRFRHYEIPGTGHMISAPPPEVTAPREMSSSVLPEGGIPTLTPPAEDESGYEDYDKVNEPIIWALWSAMYRWVDEGVPMPRAERITRDPGAPDGIARDEHGNALGGLRTPWVDVPDATYVHAKSEAISLMAGMQRFSEEKMKELYGSRDEYARRVRAKLDEMVEQGWLLPGDRTVMFPG